VPVWLSDHVTLNFSNNMSMAAVFLDIKKVFDTTWHPGLLQLSELHFPSSLIQRISSFLSNRKFRVMFEGELSTPRDIQAGVPQGSVLAPTLYRLYMNDTPQTSGVYLALSTDDTYTTYIYICTTNSKEGYDLRKLQRGLTSTESWCEHWNVKINEDKTQKIYLTHRCRKVEAFLTLKGR